MTTSVQNRGRTTAVAAATVLALFAAGCTSGSDQPSTSAGTATSSGNAGGATTSGSSAVSPSSGTATTGIDWTSCGERLECATVPVPLDWADPGGEQINLAVIKQLASKPDQRIGTMFLDPGGPGDTGIGLIRGGGDDIDKWGDGRFDLIAWDPRGTHASSPVKCFATDADAATFWDGVALPSTPDESTVYAARMKTSRSGAARRWARCCHTSRPQTWCGTWIGSGSSTATRPSPTRVCPTERSLGRCTPTCTPIGCGR
ncbi:hypothetical protein [Nakamurella multipartita]|uniref:hypothetical protein n=1 Tax=Nakamurella multipartita TaxID=53461 RepID=UPI00145F96BA|nr:hypothetical protein [Nakamurella multipartita]